ncbi:hypothetical protein GGF31_006793 [Allomyces arbusculus]|nr:hypothetical protein GGF31_006793 [Allomyces arbusculus]
MSTSAPAGVVGGAPPPEVVVVDGGGDGGGGVNTTPASAHETSTALTAATAMEVDTPAGDTDQPADQQDDPDLDRPWRDHRGRRMRHVSAGFKLDDFRTQQTDSHKALIDRAARLVPRYCASATKFRVERLGTVPYIAFDVFDVAELRALQQAGLPIAPANGPDGGRVAVRDMTIEGEGSGLVTVWVMGLAPQWTRESLLNALHGAKCDVLGIRELRAVDRSQRRWTAQLVCEPAAHDEMLKKGGAVLGDNIVYFASGRTSLSDHLDEVRGRTLWLHGLPRGYTDPDLWNALPGGLFGHATVLRAVRDKKVALTSTAEVILKSESDLRAVIKSEMVLDKNVIFATRVGEHVCYACGSREHRLSSCARAHLARMRGANWNLAPSRARREGRAIAPPRAQPSERDAQSPPAPLSPSPSPSPSPPPPSPPRLDPASGPRWSHVAAPVSVEVDRQQGAPKPAPKSAPRPAQPASAPPAQPAVQDDPVAAAAAHVGSQIVLAQVDAAVGALERGDHTAARAHLDVIETLERKYEYAFNQGLLLACRAVRAAIRSTSSSSTSNPAKAGAMAASSSGPKLARAVAAAPPPAGPAAPPAAPSGNTGKRRKVPAPNGARPMVIDSDSDGDSQPPSRRARAGEPGAGSAAPPTPTPSSSPPSRAPVQAPAQVPAPTASPAASALPTATPSHLAPTAVQPSAPAAFAPPSDPAPAFALTGAPAGSSPSTSHAAPAGLSVVNAPALAHE